MNAVAGGGTLVAFPALLATGMSARMANIVSTVGLVPGYAGGSLAYRRELEGQGGRVRALSITSLAGGVAGAVILLATSEKSFRVVVPYLILASCGLLAVTAWFGGVAGVSVARRLPSSVLRGVVITLGLVVGIVLLVRT